MFEDVLKRVNLENIGSFIVSGSELTELSNKTYTEKIKEAYSAIRTFIESNFEKDQYDDVSEVIYTQLSVFQDVYFEVGLLSGLKLANQLHSKLEEIE